ncbi:Hypothetical protein D9617_121g039630 [Elsinoe fawcettii]|nr:Hypothetical protein D9617_121g039630 [Elsinoe fawcettii]
MEFNANTSRQPVPNLSRENYEKWFNQMELWLASQKLSWTITSLTQPIVMTPGSSQPSCFDSQYSTTSVERNSAALYWIHRCLTDRDQEIIQEYTHVELAWEKLKSKYYKQTDAQGRQLQKEFVTYIMGEDTTISDAWSHLTTLGRRVDGSSTGHVKVFSIPERKIQQLLAALPPSWDSTRDAIDAQPGLTVNQIYNILKEKESQGQGGDTAMFARGRQQGFSGSSTYTCILCQDTGHTVSKCPQLQRAQRHVKPAHRVTKRASSTRRSLPSRSDSELLKMVRQLTKKVDRLEAECFEKQYTGKA